MVYGKRPERLAFERARRNLSHMVELFEQGDESNLADEILFRAGIEALRVVLFLQSIDVDATSNQ